MKRYRVLATISAMVVAAALAQGWPAGVSAFASTKGQTVTVSGKFENGVMLEDLRWANTSSTACFPATENAKFKGHHVYFATSMPARSEMTVKLIPKDPNQDVSLYGYQIGATNFRVPPNVPSAVSCEYDAKWDRPRVGRTQDHTRSIKFSNPTANTYNIFIVASGPESTKAGEFSIEVVLQ